MVSVRVAILAIVCLLAAASCSSPASEGNSRQATGATSDPTGTLWQRSSFAGLSESGPGVTLGSSAACDLATDSDVEVVFGGVKATSTSGGITPDHDGSTCAYSAQDLTYSLIVSYYKTMTAERFQARPWQPSSLPVAYAWPISSLGDAAVGWTAFGNGQLAFRKSQSVVVLSYLIDFTKEPASAVQERVLALARQLDSRI